MKNSIQKTHLLITLLTCSLLSTAAISAVPKTALLKAEPVNQALFTDMAHNHLKASLNVAKVLFTQPSTDSAIVEQKRIANRNKSITLTNTSLIAQ